MLYIGTYAEDDIANIIVKIEAKTQLEAVSKFEDYLDEADVDYRKWHINFRVRPDTMISKI